MFSVSSTFQSLAEKQDPDGISVKFTFSGSSENNRILGSSNVKRGRTKFSAGKMKIDVANVAASSRPSYNILRTDKTHFFREGKLGISFVDSDGLSTQELTLFKGKLTSSFFKGTKANLNFIDNFDKLKKLLLGTSENPLLFTGSEWNPADLFWTVATSYGRLDSTQTSGNVDIDYTTWTQWKADLDTLSYRLQAEFKGTNVLEALKKIAALTHSSIVGEGDGKIYTRTQVPRLISNTTTYTGDHIFDIDLKLDTRDIINFSTVQFAYDTGLGTFTGSLVQGNTTSINTYGQRESLFDDKTVWHATKTSAESFLNRVSALFSDPIERYRIKTGFKALRQQVSDNIVITDAILSLTASTSGNVAYTITDIDIDIDRGQVQLEVEETLGNNFFFLDDSVMGLLDFSYNPLG